MTSNGVQLEFLSVLSSGEQKIIHYSDLVSRLGIQSVPNGFGRFVVKRDLLNISRWEKIIEETGPLFSQVLEYSHAVSKGKILWEPNPILIYKQSNYHEGSNAIWKNYGQLVQSPWLSPFCGQLAGQIRYLVHHELWSKHQAEFGLFNERQNTLYIADYLLSNIHEQIKETNVDYSQSFRDQDLENLNWYFSSIATTRLMSFRKLMAIHDSIEYLSERDLRDRLSAAKKSFPQYSPAGPFSGGIVTWSSTKKVLGHPSGWLITRLGNHEIYKLLRFFDLDTILDPNEYTFFPTITGIFSKDVAVMSSTSLEEISWTGFESNYSDVPIPRIYALPSLIFMKFCRAFPSRIRKLVRIYYIRKIN
jgi:hypothetical protein